MTIAEFYHELIASLPAIGTIGMTIYVWLANRQRVKTARINNMDARIGNHETRIVCIENDMKHVPTQESITGLKNAIADMNTKLSETKGRLSGINRAVDLINEHLINT